MFKNITRLCPAKVLIVEGDAEHMTVKNIRTASDGVIGPPMQADIEALRQTIREWGEWADANHARQRHDEREITRY